MQHQQYLLRGRRWVWAGLPALLATSAASAAAPVPAELTRRAVAGEALEVIVDYDAIVAERDLASRRARLPRGISDAALLADTATRYRQVKEAADRAVAVPDTDTLIDYSHLPMRALRLRSARALAALAAHPNVRAVYANGTLQRVLTQSLPLIGQPAVAAAGYGGAGTTVAVIDDGIDIGNAAFGGCTAVGTPAGCRVAAYQTIVANPGTDFSHGTNVSAIVAGVAGQARVAMLNVFSASGASFADVILGIDWSIANRVAYNIVAINMSLGDPSHAISACSAGNSFVTPVANAIAAGISVVAAAGNGAHVNDTQNITTGLAKPACTPGVISVGAVYDSNVGGLAWGSGPPSACSDNTSQADQVICFSQTGPNLTLLAPGALITAGGIVRGGTSQASPHVAGAVAVLRAAFPGDTLARTLSRLTTAGVPVTDTRKGPGGVPISVTKPRLSLVGAARPANDDFANRLATTGASGSTSGTTLLATRETGEPVHAAPGAGSVWWTWTAPANGQVTLSTAGSGFDTQLAVYTGTTLAALTPVANNDNAAGGGATSLLLFQASSGVSYQWAVDGANVAAGAVALQWGLNTAASADLSASISGPGTATPGATVPYVVSVRNGGPQTATGVKLTLTLPAGATFDSGPAGCAGAGATVVCTAAALGNGSTVSWTLQLTIVDPGAGLTLSQSVSSDVSDAVAGNNTTTLAVLPADAPASDGDVPLPPWSLALLAAGLAGGLARSSLASRLRPVARHGAA